MLGFKIISQKSLDDQLAKAKIKGEKNSLETIQRLNDKVADLQARNARFINENLSIKEQFKSNVSMMNKALLAESELRTAIREVVEKYNVKVPPISIDNKELVKEMNVAFMELFQATMHHISLLNEMSEKADIATITKIQEYCKSLSNE